MANKEYDTKIQGIIEKQKQQNTQPQTQAQPTSIADTYHLTKGGRNQTNNTSGFNTQNMYDASLKARNALLQQNYNTALSSLENSYNTNKMELGMQRDDVNENYQDSMGQIKDQTYRNLEDGKVLQANRGIINSAMGTAQHQGMVRAGNEDMNTATRERDKMLNDLTARINNLSQSYQNSKNTLTTNFGLGKTQALNESLSEKLASDLDLYKFDTDWENRFESQGREFEHNKFMQDDQQNWQELQNNLDRQQQMAIAQLNASTQLKASQISAGAQLEAARMASVDRRAAQEFIERQWEVERQDSFDEMQRQKEFNFLTSHPDFNPNAKRNIFTGGSLGSGRDNEVEMLKQAMELQGMSPEFINQMEDRYMKTGGLERTESMKSLIDSLFESFQSNFK